MSYLVAIDQGTSSTRAMLFNYRGELVSMSQYPLHQFYPQAGWVEQDGEEIWQKTLKALQDVLEKANSPVISCGITNQRETFLLWDKRTGKCLSRAIVWQDRRTQAYCQSLLDVEKMVQEKTGLLMDPYFSGTKLHWLLENVPEAKQLALKNQLAFGTVDSFLLWRLTKGKVHATDVTNASRTLLFNIFNQQWDEELLDLFKIPRHILPAVLACDSFFGSIDKYFSGYSIPITGIAGDQQAALIGQQCFSNGMIKGTFGTGGFLLMNLGAQPVLSKHKLLTTIAYSIKNQTTYALEGSIYHAGTTIKWLRDELHLIKNAEETEVLARSLTSNEGVYIIPSFTGLGGPHWLNTQGAVIVGLSRLSNKAHFARAALESVVYLTKDILICMKEESGLELNTLRVDGGMASNGWFLEFLAAQCNLRVDRPYNLETTGLGAAFLAGLGAGIYHDFSHLQPLFACQQSIIADDNRSKVEDDYSGWRKSLQIIKN